MPSDYKGSVSQQQTRVSNRDRSESTTYHMVDRGQDDDLKRYEAMKRRNWIAVLSFVGVVVVIFLIIIITSIL